MIKEIEENEKVICEKDLEILNDMANKYCVTLQELGRIIARKKVTYPRLQILLNTEEMAEIDKKAKTKNLSRSKYCSLCYRKALENNDYENINIVEAVKKQKDKREHRAVISFNNSDEYRKLKRASQKLGIPFSCLMRYFALNVEI